MKNEKELKNCKREFKYGQSKVMRHGYMKKKEGRGRGDDEEEEERGKT